MNKINKKVTERDVELLRNKLTNLEKEFESYKDEVKLLKPKKARETIIDRFYKSRKSEQVFELNETKTLKIDNRNRLAIYELASGIVVNEISSKYHPIMDKDGKVIDTTYTKFEGIASINELKFNFSYISNQNLKDCFEDKVQVYDVRELNIFIKKTIEKNELRSALEYFQKNPSQFGLAMLCLKDYEKLFNIRNAITRYLTEANPNFVKCNFVQHDNEEINLQIIVESDKNKYFTLDWSIIWVEKLRTVIDQFKVEIDCEDENFLQSANHNIEKLTNIKLENIFISDPDDEKIRKDIEILYVLPEQEKLTLIKNAILAAKASE